ncbi:hypothetical protein TNCV_4732631 [Trichonephila clavipes]|nr:hypothetical protein TNCV_4732631 [Trichonephila clavipes]
MGRTILLERRQSESVGRRNSRTTFLRSDWPRPFACRENLAISCSLYTDSACCAYLNAIFCEDPCRAIAKKLSEDILNNSCFFFLCCHASLKFIIRKLKTAFSGKKLSGYHIVTFIAPKKFDDISWSSYERDSTKEGKVKMSEWWYSVRFT